MTKTPRTDTAEIDNSHFSYWGTGPSGYVQASFARTLEAENERLRTALLMVDALRPLLLKELGFVPEPVLNICNHARQALKGTP